MFESFGAFGFGRGDEGIETGHVDEDSLGTSSWNHSPESGYWFLSSLSTWLLLRLSGFLYPKLEVTQYSVFTKFIKP